MFKVKVQPPCRHCQQTQHVKRHGTARSGYQRYYCQSCKRTFQIKYIYAVREPALSN
ncbi:Transposase and inactivated derivatives [Leminorella richardii]|uniref:Transposase and inactivated derivatives n=1 Tax=Leminorella richardii TaxID=158841 RepID=A0A2X4UU93_9GAMM|nr:Transposase and inactivated derivatives [Leminorella richardii]